MTKVKLTAAQHSALETSPIDILDESDSIDLFILRDAWKRDGEGGSYILVNLAERDAIVRALNHLSNLEDAHAQQEQDATLKRLARGASAALTNLGIKLHVGAI